LDSSIEITKTKDTWVNGIEVTLEEGILGMSKSPLETFLTE